MRSAAFQTANTLPNTIFNLLASAISALVLVRNFSAQEMKARFTSTASPTAVERSLRGGFVSTLLAPLYVIMAPELQCEFAPLQFPSPPYCLLPQIFFYGLYNLLVVSSCAVWVSKPLH